MRDLKAILKPGGMLVVSSMVASPPYFSVEELKSLVSDELTVVGSGVLFLKPLVLYEKLLMKLFARNARFGMQFSHGTVGWLGRCFGRLFPRLARSHGYVIARKD